MLDKMQEPFCPGRCQPRHGRGPSSSSCRAFSRGARASTALGL